MAYRTRRRTTRRASTARRPRRSYSRSGSYRRTTRPRRRSSAGRAQVVRVVIEQSSASAIARPGTPVGIGTKTAPGPRRARF